MHKVKILHIADLHIERKNVHLNKEKAEVRKIETLMTFKRALDKFCDAKIVLISGDLFDNDDCADSTVDFICSVFKDNPDKLFYIACGNHDCYESSATKKLIEKSGKNVTVFKDFLQTFFLEELGVYIHGISFSAPGSYTSLLKGFVAPESDYLNIMVMHGDLGGDSKYNPISISEIGDSNLDYLALGHVHTHSGFKSAGSTVYSYPGVCEPGGFDETGECGVIYGEISKNNTNLAFYPISKRKYHQINFDISTYNSMEMLAAALSSQISSDDFYKLNLTGTKSFNLSEDVLESLIEAYYVEINDCSADDISILDFVDDISLLGKTAQYLIEHKNEHDEKVYNRACEILTNIMCR